MPVGTAIFGPTGFADRIYQLAPADLPWMTQITVTVPTPVVVHYQIPDLPMVKSCLMALNGLVRTEGSDYTVDYDTGLVTVSTTLHSGDKLLFWWVAKEHLVF